ncbi:MAG: DUF2256 domain-containing protein [Burkholderiaceae bacterium]
MAAAARISLDQPLDHSGGPFLGQTGSGYRGNKSYLPTKVCERCQRPMTWRKAWAKNWAAVKYCSEACRRRGS